MPVEIDAVRDREVVRAMRPSDRVVSVEMGADADRDGLLPGGKVHLAWDQPRPYVPLRLLVGVVVAKQRRLERPDEHHHPVELYASGVVHQLPPGLARAPNRSSRHVTSPAYASLEGRVAARALVRP